MTLVLAYIDAGVSIQVADRRLTVKDGKSFKLHTDDAVKIEICAGTFLMCYSGRSLVATKPTLEWLAQRLDNAIDLRDNLDRIAHQLDGISEGLGTATTSSTSRSAVGRSTKVS